MLGPVACIVAREWMASFLVCVVDRSVNVFPIPLGRSTVTKPNRNTLSPPEKLAVS